MTNSYSLVDLSSLSITYDRCNDWLYANWQGHQDKQSVQTGCQQILDSLRLIPCHKILNDNTNVTGDWIKAARWVGEDYFPHLADAGLHYLAWVHSPDCLSRRAIELAISFVARPTVVVVSFEEVASAYTWLRANARCHTGSQ